MKIDFDPIKNEKNVRERDLPFSMVEDFDWDSAMIIVDQRKPYPEVRYRAMGYIEERLCAVVFTVIAGGIRVISFRKANLREVKHYEKAKA